MGLGRDAEHHVQSRDDAERPFLRDHERRPNDGTLVGRRHDLPWYMQVPPSSAHPGGMNVLAGDGSVRFVKNSVFVPVWRAFGSRSGGEVVSADAY